MNENGFTREFFLGKKYNTQNALSMALASELAYSGEDQIKQCAMAWGYQSCHFVEIQKGRRIDTQCLVLSDDNHVVVAFRGSDNIADWLANFSAVTDAGPLEGSKAHEGFQDALFPAVIKLTTILDRCESHSKRLWLTGHSLGGALASLYAGMLIENNYSIYGLYTFASPRPGDSRFAEQLNASVKGPHYRVVNSGDLVPHLPPEPFFSHSGKRIILRDHCRDSSSRSWFSQRVAALRVFVKAVGQTFDVADNHRLNADAESYIPRLRADHARELQKQLD